MHSYAEIPLTNGKLEPGLSEAFEKISANVICGEIIVKKCLKKDISDVITHYKIDCEFIIDSDNIGNCVFTIEKKNNEYKLKDYCENKKVE